VGAAHPPSWGQATVVGAGHPQGVALLYANHTGHAVVQRITLNKTRQIVILMLCLVDTDVICLAKKKALGDVILSEARAKGFANGIFTQDDMLASSLTMGLVRAFANVSQRMER
jgi:hypothetical protein